MAKKAPPKKPDLPEAKNEESAKEKGNIYDKIFKEMTPTGILPILRDEIGLNYVKSVPFREKMETTVEREMDFFSKITDDQGKVSNLHIEFESSVPKNLVYRIAEYHGMSLRRKKLPTNHIVLLLGDKKPKIQTQLKPEEVFHGFTLIHIKDLDGQKLLGSSKPDVVLFAILASYPKEQTESFLRSIIAKLRKLSESDGDFAEYISRLLILSNLRKLYSLTLKIIKEMSIRIDETTTVPYKRGAKEGEKKGIEKGIEKGIALGKIEKNYEFVSALLKEEIFTDAKIAALANVTMDFVQKVKTELATNKEQ